MKIYILLVIPMTLMFHSAIGQAPVDGFLKSKGSIDAGLGVGVDRSDTYFAGTREIDLERNGINANIFAKLGLLDRLNLDISIPYVSINSNGGLQDGSAYLKAHVTEFSVKNSQVMIRLAAGFSTNLTDYKTEVSSAIGQQATVIDLRPIVHYQHSAGWFATGQFAYLVKSDPTPSATSTAIKLGRATSEHYYDVWYTNQYSDGGLDYRGTVVVNSFKELGTDYHKAGATYYRPISDKTGVYAGANYLIAGRNISQGFGVSAGIVLKVK